jgi:phosphatidate phosphatase PAH1
MLGDFNATLGKEDVFKPIFGNESLQQDIDDNGVRIVYFAALKNLVVKSTMLPHRNIRKYTWTSPNGKTYKQIDHTLIDSRWHSGILDVRSFR